MRDAYAYQAYSDPNTNGKVTGAELTIAESFLSAHLYEQVTGQQQ